MTIDINKEDLKEIKSNYNDIVNFLFNKFVSFNAVTLCIQSISDKIEEIENNLKEE